MPFFYLSGEEIEAGDRVTYDGDIECEIQFIADPAIDPSDWFVTKFGGGVMITAFGAVFLELPAHTEDLVFVSRKQERGL